MEAKHNSDTRHICSLNVHDLTSTREDVLVNIELLKEAGIQAGNVVKLTVVKNHAADVIYKNGNLRNATTPRVEGSISQTHDPGTSGDFYFFARARSHEMQTKPAQHDISVSTQIANTFQFSRGSKVFLEAISEDKGCASHVEIVFRDQYLARADMWRLVNSQLAGKCLHRGQKLVFLDSIRATVKSIFIRGRKVHTGLFGKSTKPVFRSESARYVLFIQMSKEMWDFDSQGTGEIMFDKVINGFLPDLFKRWQQIQVRHILSIVLFTRVMYDNRSIDDAESNEKASSASHGAGFLHSKDFYRVVVSDMASGESAEILNQLKREFKIFQRDISIRSPQAGDYAPLGTGLSGASVELPQEVIAGYPSDAVHGNILEAINLASSQFSSDYIDRDLVRTGVSIVVVSPGTGLFEVDYDLLAATTDNLIDNGVGIDLVCLSQMPLHSVPLFQYRRPARALSDFTKNLSSGGFGKDHRPPSQNIEDFSPSSFSPSSFQSQAENGQSWNFGIPHWIDVSFWSNSDQLPKEVAAVKGPKVKDGEKKSFYSYKPFVPRVRMYEIQMMGITDSGSQEVSIPTLEISSSHATGGMGDTKPHNKMENNRLQHLSRSSTDGEDDTPSASATSLQQTAYGARHSALISMDDHDEALFIHPRTTKRHNRRQRPRQNHIKGHSVLNRSRRPGYVRTSLSLREDAESLRLHSSDSEQKSVHKANISRNRFNPASSLISKQDSKPSSAMPLSINRGLRGLAPVSKTAASAKIDNVQSSTWTTKPTEKPRDEETQSNYRNSDWSMPASSMTSFSSAQPSSDAESGLALSSDSERPTSSKPIPIRKLTETHAAKTSRSRNATRNSNAVARPYDRVATLADITSEGSFQITHNEVTESVPSLPLGLPPKSSFVPWLTILNPSNPTKTNEARTSRLGRWQHIFPRPPKTSQIKWKSLCSPAAVPLTTEDFPYADQLSDEYEETTHTVTLSPEETKLTEHPQSLVNEVLAFRLSRGFQVVVGERLKDALPTASLVSVDVFNEGVLAEADSTIVLSRGNTIHEIRRTAVDRLQVKILTRHTWKGSDAQAHLRADKKTMPYVPYIRPMLADRYEPQTVNIMPNKHSFKWDVIDAFIAGNERPQAARFVENLRPWRARFVLIPVDVPSKARRLMPDNEKNDEDEEIRLEGIRKLTQVWQRFRFVPEEERRFQPSSRRTKDPNPLDITYQTKDTSAIVAAELNSLLEGDETGRPVQLLPEPELYQKANLNLKKLAETIQGEKGVRMLDRRWHLRLHDSCFIGMELTSWLLENFRDISTREEAESLGKDLMKAGLFKHVERRHDFRDGNYFYQIEDEFRNRRTESRGWWGRSKTSVPSTPMTDQAPISTLERPQKTTNRSRASSDSDTTQPANWEAETSRPTSESKHTRPRVALSKSLLYDVDHRHRSYRPELINLHYDRLHNPDNCYHIRVEWMNTTARFIQEAIISWATSVDRYGLRLVEVPIGEASSITSMHPFRAVYRIKLALEPPTILPLAHIDTTAFMSAARSDPLFYQKELLEKFNYVLDFEAASAFPSGVEVSYSWGQPDYKYSQYIHRSGMLIAQISHEGDFLLLANRLYNNRSVGNPGSVNAPAHFAAGAGQDLSGDLTAARPINTAQSHRTALSGLNKPFQKQRHSSPKSTPVSSPSLHATDDIPDGTHAPAPEGKFKTPIGKNLLPNIPQISTPEGLTREFQSFCHNPDELQEFYDKVLKGVSVNSDSGKSSISTPRATATKTTPAMRPVSLGTPSRRRLGLDTSMGKDAAARGGQGTDDDQDEEGDEEQDERIPKLTLPKKLVG